MRMHAALLPCFFTPALLWAQQNAGFPDEDEQGFRSAWRETFVDACSADALQEEATAWCGCVADQVLQQLEFDELLQGTGFDRALDPATAVCDQQQSARRVML